jgi:3-oxoacyl-[acyl-carrier protein] reductase
MKQVVITGTSRGIGLELVKLFSEQGHEVIALSRNAKVVEGLGLPNVTSVSCDITQEQNLLALRDLLSAKGTVDILINNAGAILNKPFKSTTVKEFKEVYDTNLFGVVGIIQMLLPLMNENSHVVNVSSMGGIQGSMKFAGLAAYSSSKGALITLTELLAEEYKETGPAFNVLALGAVQTEMLEEAFPGYKAPLTAKEMADYIANFSLKGNKYYNGKILQVSNSTP